MTGHAELLAHLTAARWYGGDRTAARLHALHRLPWLREPGDWPAVRIEVAEVAAPGQTRPQAYQLIISYRPAAEHTGSVLSRLQHPQFGDLVGTPGEDDPEARAALLAALLRPRNDGGRRTAPATGEPRAEITVRPTTGVPAARKLRDGLHPGSASRVFGGEQSNTSILYGDRALLKLFRRLQPGDNPDIEVHRALTRTESAEVATLLGTAHGSWADPDTGDRREADLAMLVQQFPDARDGWELALQAIRTGSSFQQQAAELGAALARVHHRLRSEFGAGVVDGDRIAAEMTHRLDQAAVEVPRLASAADELRRTFARLAGRRLPAQRIHGDFHLGQCLHSAADPYGREGASDGGWRIIDFEGEPLKPVRERSRPDSPVRDLAGALRSVDYAAHVGGTGDGGWARACRSALLTGYQQQTTGIGADQQPVDPSQPVDPAVLAAYTADKAVYEVIYESRHRPDWIAVPLAAITEIARSPDPGPTGGDRSG